MKKIIVIVLCFISVNYFSQTKQYKSLTGLHCFYLDSKTDKVVTKTPIGKNVNIKYDAFFKSWDIGFTDDKNEKSYIKLKYILTNESGVIKTVDESGVVWYLLNEIDTAKRIILTPDVDLKTGLYKNYEIADIKVISKQTK